MNKKYLSVILFSALMIGSTGVFTSCKDYDGDIKDLQEKLDLKASQAELQTKLDALETTVNAAKEEAEAAKDAAQEALDKANTETGGTSGVTSSELAALERTLQQQIDKLASLDAVDQKLASLKEELQGSLSEEQLKAVAAAIDEASAEVIALLGHRLTSLAVIPTQHINGIAAITFTTLQYTPQVYKAMASHVADPSQYVNRPVLDHVDIAGAKTRYISTEKNEAYFHVSPSVGVRTEDVLTPSFDCITSTNTTRDVNVMSNEPIVPTGHKIDKSVMTVTFKKSPKYLENLINTKGDAHVDQTESFYMASLKAPIAEANMTEDEKADLKDGKIDGVYVNSEYARIEELVKVPYIVNSKTDFNKLLSSDFADEVQDGNYVHYHDSVCLYESEANELIDLKYDYDKVLDLKKLVKVCASDANATSHVAHTDLENYKDYGLTFRFTLPEEPYITLGGQENNSNKTDQQKFAKIDSPMNGLMTSKVYTIDGGSATAVGREPIVRVELVDTVNNALVAQRYIKIKWVRSTETKKISYTFNDTVYHCANFQERLGTQLMNEVVYNGDKDGGMTKYEFHQIYTLFDPNTGEGDGTVTEIVNSENGVDSYNVVWDLTHVEVGKIWDADSKTFEKTFYYKDPTESNATLAITLKRTIYMPTFSLWGYDGRYWKNDNNWETFNVNPIVYNTVEGNPAWAANHKNNPTCNIYTDLLNGFLDDYGRKPTTGAGGAVYYSFKNKDYYYSAYYPQATGTGKALKGDAFWEEGVRFVFDAEKLATDAYIYQYFDGSKLVDKKAEVRNNGTELWINNEKAAEIMNYVQNNLFTSPVEMTYNIRLQEANPTHAPYSGDQPTEAAKALVGKYVPIKLVADLCDDVALNATHNAANTPAHFTTLKAYDALIIEPLKIEEGETDNFTDAVAGGSTIDVTGAFAYTTWNADENGKFYIASNKAASALPAEIKEKYNISIANELYYFYEVVEAEWMTNQITSNLKLDENGNLVPTEGVTDGPLPSNTSVKKEVDATTGKDVLTYYNYSGTPVNWDYTLYIPVKFGYKWKSATKIFTVQVSKNAGTPAQR